MSLISTTSPDVLANKGVPIELVMTKASQTGEWERHPDGRTSTHYVRFTHWKMKLLEDEFGSLAGWSEALRTRFMSAMLTTLSVALGAGWPPERIAEAMVQGQLREYRLAISAAESLAMGVDPKDVKKTLQGLDGEETTETSEAPTLPAAASSTPTDVSAGVISGDGGWDTVTTGISSGTSVSDSGSPLSTPWQ